jgi:AcrR family transcriptional regulator
MLLEGFRMRLSRVQQQEVTHERLLAAGRAVFLRDGYLAATVEEIAANAGFTRGAVYKHFGGKDGLWLAIVETHAEALLAGLHDALAQVGTRDELLATLNPAAAADADTTRLALVSAEFLAATAARPGPAAAVAAIQRRLDQALTDLLAAHCDRLLVRPAIPLPQFVTAWGALGGGLALLRAVDPTTDAATVLAGVLAALLPATDTPAADPPAPERSTR